MNIVLLLSMVLAITLLPSQEKISSEITFCNFELPKEIKHANASFYVIYSFKLDDEGRPDKIAKAVDDHVGVEQISSCLKRWRFRGLKKEAQMTVTFRWEHANGWVEATVTGPDFTQEIRISGERCPYLRMQLENSKRR